MNALAVIAAVQALGADRARALIELAAWCPPEGRGARETLILDVVDDHLRIDLIDDAFNANPASMAASLDTLGGGRADKWPGPRRPRPPHRRSGRHA